MVIACRNRRGCRLAASVLPLLIALAAAPAPAQEHAHGSAKASGHDMSKRWAERRASAAGMGVSLATDEAGVLWLARVRDGHVWVSRAAEAGQHFSEGVRVNRLPEAILADEQNRPRIAARGGVVAVVWSEALPKVFAGNIRFARSVDGGRTFSEPLTVNDDRAEIGHSFGTLAMDAQGRLALAWIDARDRAAAERAGRKHTGSGIYYALSSDGGAHFSPNRKLADHSCECCRIGLALGPDGVATALWRHVFEGGQRDFALATLEPKSVLLRASEDGWEINACPHHGGDLAIDGEGGRHLVWFTGSARQPGLFYRRADGERMTPPRGFGDAAAQAGHPTVFARGRSVHLAWREFDGKAYRLITMASADRGDSWSAARVVATADGAADLPLFVAGARRPLLAWNSAAAGVRVFDLDGAP